VKVEPATAEAPATITTKKRGRPAKAGVVEPLVAKKLKPKVRVESRKKLEMPPKMEPKIIQAVPAVKTVVGKIPVKAAPESNVVAEAPKPKKKRKSNNRRKGVYLTNWSKPLHKNPIEPKDEAPDSPRNMT
jgi:hypothetical protein